jgi:hypothetical protein
MNENSDYYKSFEQPEPTENSDADDQSLATMATNRANEAERVALWRGIECHGMGYPPEVAADLACGSLAHIEIRALDALIARGCSPMLALEIVR